MNNEYVPRVEKNILIKFHPCHKIYSLIDFNDMDEYSFTQ
jgi:hypothetical protein